ncbi:MAG: hypothetical protein JWM35_1912 [Verrucomicrobia bacterium]|nr:hypothetical protein [Verrucomicrobiota bacterium]
MKTRPCFRLLLALGIVGAGAGCASGINGRIQEKSEVFSRLPPEAQKNLRDGTIEPGYTADMVYMALGKPSKVKVKDTAQGKVGLWKYEHFFPEGYEAAPGSEVDNGATEAPAGVPATSSFVRPGSADYGHVKTETWVPSYTATDRRGFKPYAANEKTFDARSGAMEALDVPEMDSAALYVIFYQGRVVNLKLGRE